MRRFVLWSLGILAGFLVVVIISAEWIFPREKIKTMVIEQVHRSTGRSMKIEKLSLSLFGKIDLRGVEVGFTPEEGIHEGALLKLRRLGIRWKWLPLLKKRIEVSEITIEDPEVFTVQKVPKPKPVEEKIEGAAEQQETPAAAPMLFAMGLDRLVLSPMRFRMTIRSDSTERRIRMEGIGLEVSDLFVPKDLARSMSGLRGDIRLYSREGKIDWEDGSLRFSALVDVDWRILRTSGDPWKIDGHLALTTSEQASPVRLEIRAKGEGEATGEKGRIDILKALLDGETLVGVSGDWDSGRLPNPIDVRLQGDPLRLSPAISAIRGILPPKFMSVFDSLNVDGRWNLLQGRLWGQKNKIRFQIRSDLSGSTIQHMGLGEAAGIGLGLRAEGMWTGRTLDSVEVFAALHVDSMVFRMNDTTSMVLGNIRMDLRASLDTSSFPVDGKIDLGIGRCLGGDLNAHFVWNPLPKRGNGGPAIRYHGTLRADSLRTDAFPVPVSGFNGTVSGQADISGQGVEDIRVRLVCGIPDPVLVIGGKNQNMVPLRLESRLALGADPGMKTWTCDSLSLALNRLFMADVKGCFETETGRFDLDLSQAVLRNEELVSMLPDTFRRQFEGLVVKGREELRVTIQGVQKKQGLQTVVQGSLRLVDVLVRMPGSSPVRIDGLDGELEFAGDPKTLKGKVHIGFQEAALPGRRDPIRKGVLGFLWSATWPDSASVRQGDFMIESPDLRGSFSSGVMEPGGKTPRIRAQIDAALSAPDSMEAVQNIVILGRFSTHLEVANLDNDTSWIRLSGSINADSLSVVRTGGFSIRNMIARLPFQVEFNPKTGRIKSDPSYKPRSWVDYEKQRAFYQGTNPLFGNLRISEVVFGDFRLERLDMDWSVQRGYILIPWFGVDVLDGNVGGSILLNPVDGRFEDLSYEIHAQASRIDAAVLAGLKTKNPEENELNATLAFQGRGIDIARGVNLEGFFHITRIGPRFASTVLKSLDPKGSDRSIKLTRQLLDAGWKPKLFSFELRHGYVYPSLVLSQPWFSPIRIPGQLEYGRLPLEFFIKPKNNQSAEESP